MRYICHVILTVLPALCSYLASSSSAIAVLIERGILSEEINVMRVQDIMLFFSILLTVGVLGVRLIRFEWKLSQKQKQLDGLYGVIKEIVRQTLRKTTKNNELEFDMRFFVPKSKTAIWLRKRIKNINIPLYFVIKNQMPFAQKDTTEKLEFRVDPDPQGIVGACFQHKSVMFDENLKENNEKDWNLSEAQVSRTANLLWSMCVPIVDPVSNTVVAVVAFDSSRSSLKIERNEKEIATLVNTLSILLYDNVPDLF